MASLPNPQDWPPWERAPCRAQFRLIRMLEGNLDLEPLVQLRANLVDYFLGHAEDVSELVVRVSKRYRVGKPTPLVIPKLRSPSLRSRGLSLFALALLVWRKLTHSVYSSSFAARSLAFAACSSVALAWFMSTSCMNLRQAS